MTDSKTNGDDGENICVEGDMLVVGVDGEGGEGFTVRGGEGVVGFKF